MGHKNAKDFRNEELKRKRKKKPEVFRNDQLSGLLYKLLQKPEFAHLKPKREENSSNGKTGTGEGNSCKHLNHEDKRGRNRGRRNDSAGRNRAV